MKLGGMARHVAKYSIAIVLGKLASIILLPLYTRYLLPADYAVLELFEITTSVISTITATHFIDAFFYFYAKEPDAERRPMVITTAFAGVLLSGFLVGLACFLGASSLSQLVFRSPAYAPGFRVVAVLILFAFPHELGFAVLRIQDRSSQFVFLQLARLVLQIGITVFILVVLKGGFMSVLYSSAAATAIPALYFLIGAAVRYRIRVDWTLLKNMGRYTAPLGLSGGAMLFLHFGDRFFLQRTGSMESLGLYALAYKVSMLIGQAQLAFVMYWKAKMHAVLRGESASDVYIRVFTYYVLLLTTLAVFLAAGANVGLRVLTRPLFHPAIAFIPLLVGAYVIRGIGDFLRSPLLVRNALVVNARILVLTAFVCLGLYSVMIPRFHAWGAAWATLLSFSWMTGWSYWETQRVQYFTFEFGRVLGILGLGTVSLLMVALQPFSTLWAQVGVSVAAVGVFGAGMLLLLDREEIRSGLQLLGSVQNRCRAMFLGATIR